MAKLKPRGCKVCGGAPLHYKSTMCKEHYLKYHKEYRSSDDNKKRILAAKMKYYDINKDAIKLQKRKWYDENKDLSRHRRMIKKYGITYGEFLGRVHEQENRCPICDRGFTDEKRLSPCVDHDHRSGTTRGIICSSCNSALGFAGDSIETLRRMIEYLMEYKDEKTE